MASCDRQFNTLTEAQLLSLYCNTELDLAEDYIDQFLKDTTTSPVNDEFYRNVLQLKESCSKNEQLQCERKQLENEIETVRLTIWTHKQETFCQKGQCGEGKNASGSYTVAISKFDAAAAEKWKVLNKSLSDLHISKVPNADKDYHFSKMKCEMAVELAVKNFMESYQLRPDFPSYVKFHPSENEINCRHRETLKRYCTILFCFIREAGLHGDFVRDAKFWLQNMIGTLNRNAHVADHYFILCHVLRCPQEMGEWSKVFIQPLPQTDFLFDKSSIINHFLTLLHILLEPIKNRESYLHDYAKNNDGSDSSWAVVDVDGSESDMIKMTESDMLNFLNQFDFESALHCYLADYIEIELSEHRLFVLLAFALSALKILQDGLKNYNSEQYEQVCRRLALMIRLIIQNIGNIYRYACKMLLPDSLRNEFDALVCRSALHILSIKKLGVWQILVDLPYDLVRMETRYRLVYSFLNSDSLTMSDLFALQLIDVKHSLENCLLLQQKLSDLHETDATYLITALGRLINIIDERKLVDSIVTQIFHACFVHETTRVHFHKAGRHIMQDVADKYLDLVGFCLDLIDKNLSQIGGYALELSGALPINRFRLEINRWPLIHKWLKFPLQSMPNALAQQILLALNFRYFDPQKKQLFLDPNLHNRVAFALANAYDDFCSDQSSNILSGSVKKAAKFASSVSGTVNFRDQFEEFCFEILARLKFIDSKTANVNDLPQSLAGQFVKFQLKSSYSLTDPDLFKPVELMLHLNKYKSALVCLDTILPALVEEKAFLNDEKLLKIVKNLLVADETYLDYAKQLFKTDFPGDNLKNTINMFSDFLSIDPGSEKIAFLCELIHNSDPKSWNSARSYLLTLNSILEQHFTTDCSPNSISIIFAKLFENYLLNVRQQPKAALFSKIFDEGQLNDFFDRSSYQSFPYFSYVSILAEENGFSKIYQDFYNEMLRFPTAVIDQIWKKICNKHNLNLNINRLPICLWLDLALSQKTHHPIFCRALENFLRHFFRVLRSPDPSLPPIILASKYLVAFKEKLSKLLNMLVVDDNNLQRFDEIILASKAWIDEGSLRHVSRNLVQTSLPLKHVLRKILDDEENPFADYIDDEKVKSKITQKCVLWSKYRQDDIWIIENTKFHQPYAVTGAFDLKDLRSTIDRLKMIGCSCQAPPSILINNEILSLKSVFCDLTNRNQIYKIIDYNFNSLKECAASYHGFCSKIGNLNENYRTMLRQLYKNVQSQVKVVLKCSAYCKFPNNLLINAAQSSLDQSVIANLDSNRQNFRKIVENLRKTTNRNVCTKALSLILIAKEFANVDSAFVTETYFRRIQSLAVEIFYHVIRKLDAESLKYCINELAFQETMCIFGQTFIAGNSEQVEPMYKILNAYKAFLPLLTPYFTPCAGNPENFISIYYQMTQKIGDDLQFKRDLLPTIDLNDILDRCSHDQIVALYNCALTGFVNYCSDSIRDTIRKHCSILTFHKYPETFSDCFKRLLRACGSGKIPNDLLIDIASNFENGEKNYKMTSLMANDLAVFINKFLHEARFSQKCKTCSSDGLLHCWREYCEPLCKFCAVIFDSLSLSEDISTMTKNECQQASIKLFSFLRSLAAPWLEISRDHAERAAWTLNQNDVVNSTILKLLSHCILNLSKKFQSTCPSTIADQLWNFFITSLISDKLTNHQYVFESYKFCLLKAPWQFFHPNNENLSEIQMLLKFYSPFVQPLITGIVVRINWLKVVQDFDQSSDDSQHFEKTAKFYALLLDIVTRCGSRKENLTDCKASYPQMMTSLQSLSWNVVDFARLNDSLQYFVDTFGVDTVFSFEDDTCRLVLRLLEKATEFSPLAPCHSLQGRLNRLERRRLFVEMLMRCLIFYCQIKDASVDFAARYFVDAVDRLELLIAMIDDSDVKFEEAPTLLEPVLKAFNDIDSSKYFAAIKLCLFAWIDAHVDAAILPYFMYSCGRFLISFPTVLMFQEKCLSGYFSRSHPKPTWAEITPFLTIQETFSPNFLNEAKNNGYFLCLYGFFMQQLPRCSQLHDETSILRELALLFPIFKEKQTNEPIILLFLGLCLELLERQLKFGGYAQNTSIFLRELIENLQQLGADSARSILGAIGLVKKVNFAPKFKLTCNLVAIFCLNQFLVDGKNIELRISADQNLNAEKAKQQLQLLKNQRQYSNLTAPIDLALDYCTDKTKSILNVHEFYSKLTLIFYNEKYLIDKCVT